MKKWIIYCILTCIPFLASAQLDTIPADTIPVEYQVITSSVKDTCFNKMEFLKVKNQLFKDIGTLLMTNEKQDSLLRNYKLQNQLLNTTVSKTNQLAKGYEKERDIYKTSYEHVQAELDRKNKWYNNKWLWFGLGAVSVLTIGITL